ncbi:MAG: ABC transporter permease [Clostridia bacterium]|nr:ABC transporter permease [Clostridia bacterium]
MHKYLAFFHIRFSAGLQYRAAALAGIATQFFWGFMETLLYNAFWRGDPSAFPMGLQATVNYIWFRQAMLSMFNSWHFDSSIFSAITGGSISMELIRPCDLYAMWLTKSCASRLSRVVLRCMPILVIASFLPAGYGMRFPEGCETAGDVVFALAVTLISLIGSLLVVSSIEMFVYISTFYTLNHAGVRMVYGMVAGFLGGELVPLPFLPDGFYDVLQYLPFAAVQSAPCLIWGGTLAGMDALRTVGLQFIWAAVLIVTGRMWLNRSLKRVVVQGG